MLYSYCSHIIMIDYFLNITLQESDYKLDPALSVQIIILAVLLLGSGFFSASETALMAIGKIEVRHMVAQNIKGAKNYFLQSYQDFA